MNRVRVLIADDRPIFRAGVQGMLRDFAEIDIVGEAMTGRQAVEGSRRLKPDVILMDLNMLERYGTLTAELLRMVEADPALATPLAGAPEYLAAEIAYAVREEAALHLDDVLTRRVIMRLGAAFKKTRRPPAQPLTDRETEILKMVVEGKGNKAIANRLGLGEGTVKSHLRNIYRKLQVQTRTEAAAHAVQLDL